MFCIKAVFLIFCKHKINKKFQTCHSFLSAIKSTTFLTIGIKQASPTFVSSFLLFLIKQKLKTIPPLWFYIILKHRFSGAFYFNHNGVNVRKKFTAFLLTPTIQCSIIKTERQGDTCHLFYHSFPLCFFVL